jgi:hypothetical protein
VRFGQVAKGFGQVSKWDVEVRGSGYWGCGEMSQVATFFAGCLFGREVRKGVAQVRKRPLL